MPGIAIGTFGPDMAFVASSIFITSSVPKSYQGAAGSLLITIQNLSSAFFVAVSGAIGVAVSGRNVSHGEEVGVSLQGLKASWWFALAGSIFAAILTAATVRIKKAVEAVHVDEEGNPQAD